MEKKVSEHDDIIHKDLLPQVKDLKNLAPRVKALEDFAAGFTEKVTVLTNDVVRVQTGQAELGRGQKELEMTVKVENEKSRKVIEDATEVIKETKGTANKVLDHILRQDEKTLESQTEIKKARWETIGKVSVVLASGGGIIWAVINALMSG